ncbi:MAG: prepilin-type N-terminal cleavage/methylation domain-containing protein [Opitutus sp.]|nr:prepilin-type N-terminal cleavage/methylation domain-containing protein [Opitutus sp.]
MKKHRPIKSSQGFTLLELALVLAIIAVLVSTLLPKGFDALRNARVQQVAKTVETLKTALTNFIALPGGNGSIPRTEGVGVPTSGAALTGATDVAKGNGARLDSVLLVTGMLEKPVGVRMGTQTGTSTGTGSEMTWNQALVAFVVTPDAVPQRNWSGVSRAEARTTQQGVLPSVGLGANFRLDGVTDLPANQIVSYLVIPSCAYADAYALATQMNGAQLAPVLGAASDTGVVAYAAPANGVTDVYIYLASV